MVSMQVAALVAAISGMGETVLLDFQAPWCAPCRSMDSTVAEMGRAGYPVRKVNIDNERELVDKYQVKNIPCFVLLVDGQEAGRLTGAVRRSELLDLYAKGGVGPNGARREILRGQSPDPPQPGVPMPGQFDRDPFTPGRAVTGSLGQGGLPGSSRSAVTAQDLISASVRLNIQDATGSSYGSGTIIDSRQGEALVLTCGHIFRDSQGKGAIAVDMFGPQAPQKLPGRLVAYDLKNDIGLVSIRPGVTVNVAPVAPKGCAVSRGDSVTTVGCNNGGPATAVVSKVTATNKFVGPANVQVAGMPVQGRSGGGLFNAGGEVIGVCNAADPADNEGLFAALPLIHGALDQAGLASVYAARSGAALAGLPAAGAPSAGRMAPVGHDGAALGALDPAALAELRKRADGAEVICIVRSLNDPQAKSEVIMLDRASAALLQQLAADRAAQDSRHLTSFDPRRQQQAPPNAATR
jgi:thiol-disulfide isomerase/thioredoxin